MGSRGRALGILVVLLFWVGACAGDDASPESSSDSAAHSVDTRDGSGCEACAGPAQVSADPFLCGSDGECPTVPPRCEGEDCAPVPCMEDSDCPGGSPCEAARCEEGACAWEALDGSLPDDVQGDCRRPRCEAGDIIWEEDPDDLPSSEGLSVCERAVCEGGRPAYRADDALCPNEPGEPAQICMAGRGCVRREGVSGSLCPPVPVETLAEEICGNGLDNNGDGIPDSGCPCTFGAVQPCFAGPAAARGVGQCTDGWQVCVERENPRWSRCEGGILPEEERCDGRDNACNGCVDDVPDCRGTLSCPDNEIIEPLRFYDLDASDFFDGRIESVRWSIESPPNSATRRAERPRSAQTRFFVDVSGDYQVTLTIVDDKNLTWSCSWIVRAEGAGLRVELRWDTFGQADLDLHLHRSGTQTGFCTLDDCYFRNCSPFADQRVEWSEYPDTPGGGCRRSFGESCPNPRLDLDNVRTTLAENINIDHPRDGDRFRTMVHLYSKDEGVGPSRPVVSVWCGGQLRAVLGRAPDEVELQTAGTDCQGDSWRVADVITAVDADTGAVDCTVLPLEGPEGGWDLRRDDASY